MLEPRAVARYERRDRPVDGVTRGRVGGDGEAIRPHIVDQRVDDLQAAIAVFVGVCQSESVRVCLAVPDEVASVLVLVL